jgi:hypothetical protein
LSVKGFGWPGLEKEKGRKTFILKGFRPICMRLDCQMVGVKPTKAQVRYGIWLRKKSGGLSIPQNITTANRKVEQ